jgi:UDP-N-acetylmuramate dehydrogenase
MRWESDVMLSDEVRWRIGGAASRFARVESVANLVTALVELEGEAHLTLGWGANLLVADRGVTSPVLVLGGELESIRGGPGFIDASGAAGLPSLVGEARRKGAEGWSFLEAVPGSVGGGLRMNAGSADIGIWDRVIEAEAVTGEGEVVRLTAAEARPSYRRVELPEDWVFTAARFETSPGDPDAVEAAHFERRRRKVATQVYDLPSCGSVWKNPGSEWGSAWELVEAVGMRGARAGGAQITEKHANFIANLDEARAEHVLELMSETRRRVLEQVGVALEPEIRFWGFEAEELRRVGAVS